MKRDTRSLRYDSDPQGVTRRDVVPAPIRFAEESSPASSAGPMRELRPYPGLRPHADEPTVNYGRVQDLSAPPQQGDGERPSDVPAELRSGTRVTPTSTLPPTAAVAAPSTTPPASHVKAKAPHPNARIATPLPSNARIATPRPSNARIATPLPSNARIATPLPSNARIATPLPRSEGRYATASVSFAPPPKPISAESPAFAPPASARTPPRAPSLLGTVSIALITIVLAAIVGATLGDGSLQQLWSRSFGAARQAPPAAAANPAPTAPVALPAAPAVRPHAVAPAQSSPPVPAEPSAPALRFEDLPAEQAPAVDPPAPPVVSPRLHPRAHQR